MKQQSLLMKARKARVTALRRLNKRGRSSRTRPSRLTFRSATAFAEQMTVDRLFKKYGTMTGLG
ncbi:hypothetical protein Z946_1119 [Sulfitobacter noctilucicola]|uniref:Uncharacterized protein n=1 Tax=Sulfitobacter noctilucicola TaxID=1342301 RepID=A0A7W6M865_9RHOB|nr:hypothetical protein [Sulfitobacter noctilucicola]KIN62262.1 hypothetical protein Z946_1119 [Sulfitobacter noctilucicola]MBB4173226.1 hypothetical protein [Sulfitobacter noctilucicola]